MQRPANLAPADHDDRTAARGISQIQFSTADLDRLGRFYTEVLGLRETVVLRQSGPPHRRHALFQVGDTATVLHVIEAPAGDPCIANRRDHLGFLVADRDALQDLATRLRACGASDGDVHPAGPFLSVRYRDPDGADGEVNCPNPDFVADAPGACAVERAPADEGWLDSMTRVPGEDHA